MSKDAKAVAEGEEGGGEGEATPKKNKKLIVIIVAAALLLGAGGGVAYTMMHKNAANHDGEHEAGAEAASDQDSHAKKKKKNEKEAPPIYVALEVFTVNLVPEQGDQFLQLNVSVEVADAPSSERLRLHMPKLRNNMMLLLSGHKASELISKEGKEQLAEDMRDQMNEMLNASASAKAVEDPVIEVLFTAFIIQ
jgi:flagellar FliL protein